MNQLKVAILRGGPSREYDVSLRTGQNVINNLNKEKFSVEDIFISKDGVWHRYGLPVTPEKALQGIDVVFNAMHGDFGEDGRVQQILESLKMPYTGSTALSSAMSLNKIHSKEAYKKHNLKTPEHISFLLKESDELHKIALKIFREFPQPSVIKPVAGGSSKDIHFCSSYEDIYLALDDLSKKGEPFLVEEFIFGKEASAAVLEDYRDQDLYAFSPVEIEKPKPIFSYDDKYGEGKSRIHAPGRFSHTEREILRELAKEAHDALGLRHYSQSDFIISPRGIYILETNALPGLTETSLMPQAIILSGMNVSELLDHLLYLSKK